MPSGEVHAKLSQAQRAELRRRFADGESPGVLAREYKVARSTVYAVSGGADQRAEPLATTPGVMRGRPPSATVRERNKTIRARYASGERLPALATEFGLAESYVRNICDARETRALRIQRDYLTASDAAAELRISRFTMNEYLHAGRFPGAFQIGDRSRFWLVPRAAVAARQKGIT